MERDRSPSLILQTPRRLETPPKSRRDSVEENDGVDQRISMRIRKRRRSREREFEPRFRQPSVAASERYERSCDRSPSPEERRSRRSIERHTERLSERRSERRSPERTLRDSRYESDPYSSHRRRRWEDDSQDRRNVRHSEPKRKKPSDSDSDKSLFQSFLNAFKTINSGSHEKLSNVHNVIPEFDPMVKEQSIDVWLSKVEECRQIYGWNEKQVIHYALPKLSGIAKTWYQGLPSVLFTWDQWKSKLMESFPTSQNYGELLTEMLGKKLRFGESPELYFYSKINLLYRCKIRGKEAVDCLIYGIEDRGMRLGAQAGQFLEPEHLLKFFKTVKHSSKDIDNALLNKEKNKNAPSTTRNSTQQPKGLNKFFKTDPNKIVCFNCNEPGHPSFRCSKPLLKCGRCNLLGHLTNACPKSDPKNEDVKKILKVSSEKDSNLFTFPITMNNSKILCHLDLGSECTLIRLTDALKLGLCWKTDHLPLLKGLGNVPYRPIGSTYVDIIVQGLLEENVEVLVVDDTLINFAVLLGHSFTERPGIKITKTPEYLQLSRVVDNKMHLLCHEKTFLEPGETKAVPVKTLDSFTGNIYVNGSIRGHVGSEYFLFSGEYNIINSGGRLLLHNMSDQILVIESGQLLSRGKIYSNNKFVCSVSMQDDDNFEPEVGENIALSQKDQLLKLLLKYKNCFSSSLKDLGFTNVTEMVIDLKDDTPVVYRPYRMAYSEREDVRRMVGEMLDCGIVKESSSPYASPIVIVKKKSGEKRLCVDYRALNNRTKRDHYPLPRVEDLLDELSGHNMFVSLDLASGYYQIPIREQCQEKTAFVTPDGQYEYTRMPFGLANAPSVFQRAMHKILNKAKLSYVIVYMDDVLIPARSFEEAMTRLEEVLSILREAGLTLKLKKCKFMFHKIDFLGFEISGEGVRPGSLKTDAVSKFPAPSNQHEVRRFLGLASFFRRFVRGFASLARPLTSLLRKDSTWKWGKDENTAFSEIKSRLVSRPVLALYDRNLDTQLHTDASKVGIAGILLQRNDDLWRPVAYYSRQTTADEQKYHSFELETLAVIASLNRFRVYLLGLSFKIITDCHSLRTTLTKKDLVPRIARWWIQLQEFDCEFEFRPGQRMSHVDALSRGPVETQSEKLHVLDILLVSSEDWIATVQSTDEEICRMKEILFDPELGNKVDVYTNFKLKNGRVFRVVDNDSLRWVVPRGSRWQVTKANHDDIGHFGVEKTLDRIRALYWFPKMRTFVKKYVTSCLECAHHKMPGGAKQGLLHPIEKTEIPFHTLHADHLGPFNKSKKRNSYILVLIDAFTKYITLTAVKSTKTSENIKVFKNHIGYFGTPTRLISDRGSCFTSNKFKHFIQSSGIKHILNAVSTPRANGQVERYNRTILASLGAMTHDKDPRSWDQYLPDVQLGINTTVHDTTKMTPTELLFGRRVVNPSQGILNDVISESGNGLISGTIDDARADASNRMQKQSDISKKNFDKRRRLPKQYEVGDLVRIIRAIASGSGQSKKLEPKLQGPYRVIKVLPNDRYVIEDTPLSRKGRRYEAIVAVDKMHPWLSFRRESVSSEDNDSDTEKNNASQD